mgnify:CR=1 FL=1
MRVERFYALGLTGGIASGKSLASKYLSDRYAIYDADQIVHDLYRTDMELIDTIGRIFGPNVIKNGQVDRNRLREIVFSDRRLLHDLNSLVHPIVGKVIVDAIRKHRDTRTRGIFVIPLLCENGWNKKLDGSLLISCSVEKQIQRLYKRDGFSRDRAISIIKSQMPLEQKMKLCTWVIKNDDEPQDFFDRLNEWEDSL